MIHLVNDVLELPELDRRHCQQQQILRTHARGVGQFLAIVEVERRLSRPEAICGIGNDASDDTSDARRRFPEHHEGLR